MALRYTEDEFRALRDECTRAKRALDNALRQIGNAAQADNNTWHDNAAFDAANETARHAQAYYAELRDKLCGAIIVEMPDNGVVGIGSTVTIMRSDGSVVIVAIVGDSVTGNFGGNTEILRISTDSPLGASLLGKTAGDDISFVGPRGHDLHFRVISVR